MPELRLTVDRIRSSVPVGRRRSLGASLLVGMLTLLVAGIVLGVHDEGFQLEGNVTAGEVTYTDIDDTNPGNPVNTVLRPGDLCDTDQEPPPGPYDTCGALDWDSLLEASGPNGEVRVKGTLPAGWTDVGSVVDFRYTGSGGSIAFDTSDGTTFTGGSKDTLPVSGWSCVGSNNVTNKGDLGNVYAGIYTDGGDDFFYFGAEKGEDSGTNNIGLWLLQDSDVGCPPDQTGNGTAFSGMHLAGDLFIVSEFTNGGGVSTIVAYEWVDDTDPGTSGNQPGLNPNPVAVGADCLDTPLTGDADELCAVTNGTTISIPWLNVFGNVINASHLPATFFEGGIELSAFPQFSNTCFTSFLFNTRSSTSLTATLFDWALGDIDTCGSKSGTKFEDDNADGVFDAGESGLSGWTIKLYEDDGDQVLEAAELASMVSTTTDSDGNYTFDDLLPGDYIVCEVQQTGWTQSLPHASTPADGTTVRTDTCDLDTGNAEFGYAFEIVASEDEVGNDFGNWQAATKEGRKFEDLNADGDDESGADPGKAGFVINAYLDGNGDGVLSATEFAAGAAGTNTTDATGAYSISGLMPGKYVVCEVQQTGWTQSYPTGTDECTGSATLGADGWAITLTSGQIDSGNDFGNWQAATKSGFKFYDNDMDGNYEPSPSPQNDTKIAGWKIELWKLNGVTWSFVADDTTDTTGYSFTGLAPGTYAVCEVQQVNYVQSFPYTGATLPAGETVFDCSALTPNSGGTFGAFGIRFTATSGASLTDNLFGNFLVPPGCTLTQGYWKTHSSYGPAAHPDDTWDLLSDGPDTPFFDSTRTWYQVFWTSPKGGNAWLILAHQYMAAQLNLLNGSGTVTGLASALSQAEAILDAWDTQMKIPKNSPDRATAITLAGFLASYNEGFEGVPHCGEDGFTGFTVTSGSSASWILPPVGFLALGVAEARRRMHLG